MKKKIYIAPLTTEFTVNIVTPLLSGSLIISENEVSSGFTKDSGDWDIWGNGSDSGDDYDDYDY